MSKWLVCCFKFLFWTEFTHNFIDNEKQYAEKDYYIEWV
jgi:hypothetical protein